MSTTNPRKCDCDHFWTEHDLYGCHHNDGCTQIDRNTRYDKTTNKAVETPSTGEA